MMTSFTFHTSKLSQSTVTYNRTRIKMQLPSMSSNDIDGMLKSSPSRLLEMAENDSTVLERIRLNSRSTQLHQSGVCSATINFSPPTLHDVDSDTAATASCPVRNVNSMLFSTNLRQHHHILNYDAIRLSGILSVCKITAKVISGFHWNLVLWLGQPIRRTD